MIGNLNERKKGILLANNTINSAEKAISITVSGISHKELMLVSNEAKSFRKTKELTLTRNI